MGRLRLVSDGTPRGTRLIDVETNEVIHGVQKVTLTCEVGAASRATVLLQGSDGFAVQFEVAGMQADIDGRSRGEVVAELVAMGEQLMERNR